MAANRLGGKLLPKTGNGDDGEQPAAAALAIAALALDSTAENGRGAEGGGATPAAALPAALVEPDLPSLVTTEYTDPAQAAQFDVRIPAGGVATNLRTRIENLTVPGDSFIVSSISAPAGFDVDQQQIFFRPVYFSPLLNGESVLVTIEWSVDGAPHQAQVLVNGRTGNETAPLPAYEGTDGPDILSGNVSAPIYRYTFGERFFGRGGDDVIHGGMGTDEIHGGPGDDYVAAGGGDYIGPGFTSGGYHRLYGDEGNDILVGGAPSTGGMGDFLYGGPGNDVLLGTDSPVPGDELRGEAGDDLLEPLGGFDLIDGGAGFDTVDYSDSPQGIVVLLASTDASGVAGQFANTAAGGYARPDTEYSLGSHSFLDRYVSIERVIGSKFGDFVYGGGTRTTAELGDGDDHFDTDERSGARDIVYGGAGSDSMRGGGGPDLLIGQAGHDSLYGENGADFLKGDAGDDQLWGGAGPDVFRLSARTDGRDVIWDFTSGEDTIDIPDFISVAQVVAGQRLLDNGDLVVPYAGPAFLDATVTLKDLGHLLTPTDFI